MIWIVSFLLAVGVWRLWEGQKVLRREAARLNERLESLEASRPAPLAADDLDLEKATVPSPLRAATLVEPPAEPEAPPAVEPPRANPWPPLPEATPAPRREPGPTVNLGEVLAEKGLAWLGGGALVLGGVFLVGYAAQQGLLTPLVRLVMAVGLAGVMLLASEVLRRRPGPKSQPLASAVLAGAGASTLYATLWAAHTLYHYISGPIAAVLLLAVSALLLALSYRRREPLALMALLGAYAAPLLSSLTAWGEIALGLHILAVAATGLTVAERRGWPLTALAASVGALALNLIIFDSESWRTAVVPVAVMAATLVYLARRAAAPVEDAPAGRTGPDQVTPYLAMILAGLAALVLFNTPTGVGETLTGTATALLLVAMAAEAARRGLVTGWLSLPPVVAATLGLAVTILLANGPSEPILRGTAILAAAAVAFAALRARLGKRDGPAVAIAPVAVLLLAQIASWGLEPNMGAGLAMLGGLPAALAAAWLGRRGGADEALHRDAWILSAAAALLLAVYIRAPMPALPAAFAGAGLVLAALQRRLAWRGLTLAALGATGLATAASLSEPFVGAALAGPAGAAKAVAATLGAGALAALAAWRLRPEPPFGAARQVLAAAAAGLGLIGAFLGLRFAASGETPAVTLLMEASLRTLLLALSGASALLILRDVKGLIARFGPHVLLVGAALSALIGPLTLLNPWWGYEGEAVEATPLLNSLLLAYLAPAAAFGLASVRLYRRGERPWARAYGAVGAGLALVWGVMAIRHGFHGPRLADGATTFAEICAHGVLLGAVPLILRRLGPADARTDAVAAAEAVALIAAPAMLLGTALLFNPWWGAAAAALGHPALALPALAAVAVLAAVNARALTGMGREVGLVIAALQALILATLTVRWAFHPVDLTATRVIGLETWTYSALWALLGAGLLGLGSAMRERGLRWLALAVLFATAGKVLVFDMDSLSGVIRAASFLAVGALMVAAAVLARRLGKSSRP